MLFCENAFTVVYANQTDLFTKDYNINLLTYINISSNIFLTRILMIKRIGSRNLKQFFMLAIFENLQKHKLVLFLVYVFYENVENVQKQTSKNCNRRLLSAKVQDKKCNINEKKRLVEFVLELKISTLIAQKYNKNLRRKIYAKQMRIQIIVPLHRKENVTVYYHPCFKKRLVMMSNTSKNINEVLEQVLA